MKKIVLIFMFVFMAASMSFALTNETLIDFGIIGDSNAMQGADDANSIAKLSDFYTDNWVIDLNSSADTLVNQSLSYVTNTVSTKYTNVIGIRVHYPVEDWSSYARVMPPYAMEIYGGEDGQKFTKGKGVIQNVQTIKSITSWVYGRNFLVMYYVNLADQDGMISSYPMGYTYFSGWRELTWNNANYITSAERRALKREPMYPRLIPSIRLDSMLFYRSRDTVGGNFITYVRDIKVDYEPAFVVLTEDINDEGTWHIIETERDRKKVLDEKRLLEIQELREIEKLRLQTTGVATEEQGTAAAGDETVE